jgi:hypothetical protein
MIPIVANSFSQMIVHAVAFASSSTSLLAGLDPRFIDSLDNGVRDELQRWSHGLFLWVLISAFLVAVGVALEGPKFTAKGDPFTPRSGG